MYEPPWQNCVRWSVRRAGHSVSKKEGQSEYGEGGENGGLVIGSVDLRAGGGRAAVIKCD